MLCADPSGHRSEIIDVPLVFQWSVCVYAEMWSDVQIRHNTGRVGASRAVAMHHLDILNAFVRPASNAGNLSAGQSTDWLNQPASLKLSLSVHLSRVSLCVCECLCPPLTRPHLKYRTNAKR